MLVKLVSILAPRRETLAIDTYRGRMFLRNNRLIRVTVLGGESMKRKHVVTACVSVKRIMNIVSN